MPYDSGLVFVRDAAAHRAAMGAAAAYLPPAPGSERDPMDYVPEMCRRARGFPVYAALRSLGRDGLVELVERTCRVARRMADRLAARARRRGAQRGRPQPAPRPLRRRRRRTRDVIARVQDEGTAWLGGTTFHGRVAMRISVSNWATDEADGDRSVEAIARCLADARGARSRAG